MKSNRFILLVMVFVMASFSRAQDLWLNDSDYFERQGVNVLVFSNSFNGNSFNINVYNKCIFNISSFSNGNIDDICIKIPRWK